MISRKKRFGFLLRIPVHSEWDQLLGPLTLSKYDRMQFQFRCLKGFFCFTPCLRYYRNKTPVTFKRVPKWLDSQVDENVL